MAPTIKEEQIPSQATLTIPRLVKRNTIILAVSQALTGAGTQMTPVLGPLLSVELLGTAAMAGLAVSITGISRLLVAYPVGKLTDTYGRRVGMALGLIVGMVGTLVIGFSAIWHSFPIFVLGMLTFGLGMGAVQQLRVAAADMYPPSRRGTGLGYVLTGSIVGAFAGPVVISAAQFITPHVGLPALATPWLLVPVALVVPLALISRIRPDPKEIAANLAHYYPGYQPPAPPASVKPGKVGIGTFWKDYPKRVAFVTSFSAQGNMNMIMATTSLALAHHGHALTAVSLSVTIHVLGMFGFSIPLGKLADVLGRRLIMISGTFICMLGAVLVSISPEWGVITLGTFLVGLGWSCVNVSATAVIADTTQAHERGRATGTNDAFSSAAAIILPLLAGPLVDMFGLNSIAVIGVLLMAMPLPFLLRLREPSPGTYGAKTVVVERA